MRRLTIFLAVLVAIVAVLLFTPLGDRPLAALFPVRTLPDTELSSVDVTGSRNRYLVCPPEYCASAPHARSPEFAVPAERLREVWKEVIGEEPRVVLLAERGERLDYMQRTPLLRFPDLVSVRFEPVSESSSTVVVYSRSIYGVSDLGTNRRRVTDWVEKVQARAAPVPSSSG